MKKFLLITYYWPPCGGVSVQRWLSITKYMMMYDWLPTIITTENGDYPYIDKTLNKKVSSEIKVIRTKTPTFRQIFNYLLGKEEKLPYGSLEVSPDASFLKKILYLIRTQIIIPDARVIWNHYAFKAAENAILRGMYEAVITTGPPHSTHLIGLKLQSKYGLKWVADFRDPWTKIYYLQSEKRNFFIKYIDKILESKVVQKADKVVTVSEHIQQNLPKGNKCIISNSYDPDDFYDKIYEPKPVFRIKFVGALTDSRKKEVLKTLFWIDDFAQTNNIYDIEFTLIGAFEEQPLDIIRKFPHIRFNNLPFMEHKKVLEECVQSEILLLVINKVQYNQGILTYKLFEYIGSQTYIMGVAPNNSDAQKILNKYNAGELYNYEEKDLFLNKLNMLYNKWKNNENIKNKTDCTEVSTPHISSLYADVLNEITERKVYCDIKE
jgi:predicted SnoaL-like aldol condensation-catalyzing enzyme